jgi:DNA polymerase-3 subunit delta
LPVLILAGEEELLLSEKLEVLKEKLLDSAWASFNYSRASEPELKQIIDAAAALPFGPGNKVMVFDNCELFTKKRGGKSDDDSASKSKSKGEKILEDLDRALTNVSPNTYVILCCPHNFDKTLKVSKVFEKHAEIESFDKIKYWPGSNNPEMLNWGRKRAHRYGSVIEDEAIDYLAESYEANLRLIAMEIEKASIYILPEKTITLKVVSQLSPHFSNVFALLDNWVHGEKALVLSGLQEVLSKSQSAIPIFAVIQTTLSKWLNIKSAAERVLASLPGGRGIQRKDLPPAEMAKRLQSEIKMNPWVLKMDLERVHRVSLEHLVAKKQELTRLENAVKTGMISDVHALTIFFT